MIEGKMMGCASIDHHFALNDFALFHGDQTVLVRNLVVTVGRQSDGGVN
jgi:hypothetical protein